MILSLNYCNLTLSAPQKYIILTKMPLGDPLSKYKFRALFFSRSPSCDGSSEESVLTS